MVFDGASPAYRRVLACVIAINLIGFGVVAVGALLAGSAALAANSVVLVVELTVASLRQAQRRLELLRSVGIEDDAIQVVVNRVESRLFRTIGVDDVAKTLHHPVAGTVALDAPAVSAAQNQGMLVGRFARKSRFAADIARLGEALRAGRLARAH